MKHIKLIFLFVAVIGAFVLGFLLNTPDAPSSLADATLEDSVYLEDSVTYDDTLAVESIIDTVQIDPVQEKNKVSTSTKIKKILLKDDLTFAEVNQLAQSHPDDALVQSYKKVVDAIQVNSIERIRGDLLSKLTPFQRNAIRIITFGETWGNPALYSDAEKQIIKKILRNQRFASFREMEDFKSHIRAKVNDEIKRTSAAPSYANEESILSETLQKNNLTFAEIDELYRSHPQDVRVQSFKNVITAIRKGVPEAIIQTDLKHLTFDQREAVRALYWGYGKEPYTTTQKDKIKKMLSRYRFSSFRDLIRFQREIELDDYLL